MADGHRAWKRQGGAFWRARHEAWKRSDLNQRHYCEVHGLPQKAFENWRQKFRAEPNPPELRLLYRRRPLSPPLSPPVSPPLGPVTYPSSLFRERVRVIGWRHCWASRGRGGDAASEFARAKVPPHVSARARASRAGATSRLARRTSGRRRSRVAGGFRRRR
jgi:hypothetical protein